MRIIQGIIQGAYNSLKKEGKSDKEIKQTIKDTIRNVRFFDDNSGYVFIYNYEGTNVLHPLKPQLEGKNLIGLKDSNGLYRKRAC
jgi:methyl-accepting chemotaxis protein